MCSASHAKTQAELRRAASSCSRDFCGSMVEVLALQALCVGENAFPVFRTGVFHQVCKESFLFSSFE